MDLQQQQMEAVRRVSQAIFQTIELDQLLEMTLRTALEEVEAEGGSILLANHENKQLVFQYSLGGKSPLRGTSMPWDRGISGAVFQSGQPRITHNVQHNPDYYSHIDRNAGFVTRNMITVPLQRWKGEPIGVLNVLNKLEGRFGQQDLTLLSIISAFAALAIQQTQLFEVAIEKQRMDQALSLAHDIQMNLLPRGLPFFSHSGNLDIHAALIPAHEVGGDFYDYFLIDDEHLFFVIGDVAGKGIPAALVMAVTKTLVKAFSRKGLLPHLILAAVNQELCLNNDSCTFVTLFCGILNSSTGKCQYANAGHNPPFLISQNGTGKYLSVPPCMAVGILGDAKFSTHTIHFRPYDSFFLYTDGITEAINSEETCFAEDRLERTIRTLPRDSSREIVEGILRQVRIFSSGQPQADDITALNILWVSNS